MQYASMSRELLRSENYLFLFDNGKPYLDKPPLIFWITGIFFKLFGPYEITYRIPSLLFSLLTIYSTFKFSRLYYSERTAEISALILASCEALIIMNADVRTDIFLIGPMMLAIWQLSSYFIFNSWLNLIVGSIAISLAMMGKGPLGLIIPITLIGTDLLIRRRLQILYDIKIVVGFFIIAAFLLPMSHGLYNQFGLDGIKFFYWTQSFGRISGESSWSNETGPLYLFNVFLYAFLPWTFIFLAAFYSRAKDILKGINKDKSEIISFFGFLIPLIMLSLSNYKLPHYIYCVCPFASILTAFKLEEWMQNKKTYHLIFKTQNIVSLVMILIIFGISIFGFFTGFKFFIPPIILIFTFVIMRMTLIIKKAERLFIVSVFASVVCSYGFNLGIMKPLLEYQSQSSAASFIIENNLESYDIYQYDENPKAKSRSLNFYLDRNIEYLDSVSFNKLFTTEPILVFTTKRGYEQLQKIPRKVELVQVFNHTRVSKISGHFLNPKTRDGKLTEKYLLKIS